MTLHAKTERMIEKSKTHGRPATPMLNLRFGRLVVVARGAFRPQGGGQARWVCVCDCGKTVEIPGFRLRQGNTKSCGCFRRDRAGGLYRTHGKSKTVQYCMFYDARKRAFALSLPFDLEPEDIAIPEKCPVLGLPLLAIGSRDNRPSLDRIVPSRGYTKQNIAVISFRANRIKSDANKDELKRILAYMESNDATVS